MRVTILSILAVAGSVLAAPDGGIVSQISDGMLSHTYEDSLLITSTGQIQAPTGSATGYGSPPPTSSEVVTSAVPATPTSAPPAYGSTSVSVVTSSTSPAAPVSSSASPLPSYPVPGNETVPVTTGGATGQPTLPPYGSPSASSTEGGGIGTTPPASATANVAGIVGAQMGLTGVAVVGLLAFLA